MIYLAFSPSAGPPPGRFKVGYSSHPMARVEELRTGVPDLELVSVWPGTLDDEQALHALLQVVERLGPFRVRHVAREWYRFDVGPEARLHAFASVDTLLTDHVALGRLALADPDLARTHLLDLFAPEA